MKTNSAARQIRNLRLRLAGLTILALVAFDVWAGLYCYRNLARTSLQPAGAQMVWNGSVTGSELFPSF
jgi:hypothetical protein